MLLRSQIAEELLSAGAELIVCSPNANEEYFREEFSHPQITLEKMPTKTTTMEQRLSSLRQYVLMNPSLGGTLNYKRETLRREQPKRYYMARIANLVLGKISLFRNLYMKAEEWLYPASEFNDLLERHQPDLVVTGTPGFNIHDVHMLRAANRHNITTATVMLSWDNLTSKGYMNGVPDHLLVWSELMADEAVQYHDFPRQNITWTGAAQFDIYHQYRKPNSQVNFDAKQWKIDHKVPVDHRLLVYGTINPAICPHEIELIHKIIEVVNSGELPEKVFLWIRLHPQVVQGPYQQSLQPFLDLESPNVHVEVPPVRKGSLNWDLPKSDAHHLASLLTAADILATTSSTLSIDAACVDTPVVNLFFDGITVDPSESVARFKKYTHYSIILETNGIRSVHNEQELKEAMCEYINDPTNDQKGREAIIAQQLGQLDGLSGKRTAKRILELTS